MVWLCALLGASLVLVDEIALAELELPASSGPPRNWIPRQAAAPRRGDKQSATSKNEAGKAIRAASLLLGQGKFDQALPASRAALQLAILSQSPLTIASARGNFSLVGQGIGDFEAALAQYEESLPCCRRP